MDIENPIRQIHDNLLVNNDGDVFAYFKIRSESISNHDVDKKGKRKERLANTLKQLASYGEFELSMIPKDMGLRERFFGDEEQHASLSDDFADDVSDVANYYANRSIQLLEKEFDMVTTSYYVVGVRLKIGNEDQTFKETFKTGWDRFSRRVVQMVNYDVILDDDYFRSFNDENDVVNGILRQVNGTRLTAEELRYFIRYNFVRGMRHSVVEESQPTHLKDLSDAVIDAQKKGLLHINNELGESYAAFLPIADMPEDVLNTHLFEMIQMLKFPVEFHLKARSLPTKGLMSNNLSHKVERIDKEIKNEDRDRVKSNALDISEKGRQIRNLIPKMKNSIEAEKAFFGWLGVFVVHGATPQEVRESVKRLRNILARSVKVRLSRATGLQIDLFYLLLPGYSIRKEKRWIQTTTHEGLAENLFGISHALGNNAGWVIGRVVNLSRSDTLQQAIYSSKDLVFFNPLVSNQGVLGAATASPHIPITGQTGMGKSFLVKLIIVYLAMLAVKVLYVDPKAGEFERWVKRALEIPGFKEKYPQLVKLLEQFHFITLDPMNRANWGALDPIVFMAGLGMESENAEPDADPAFDVALAMIEQVFEVKDQFLRSTIEQAIKETIIDKWQGKTVGMLTVIEKMKQHENEDIQVAAMALETTATSGLLRLSFSDGHVDSVDFKQRITILQVAGLDLPGEQDDSRTYTSVQRKSLAVMLALGKYADRFGRENPDEYTFEIIDEAWIFNVSSLGRAVLKSIKRVGRSYNNALVYATQSIDDITSEDDHGQFGVLFAFDEESETDKILKHFNLEASEENIEWLHAFKRGEALYRDVYGRVGKIAVHAMFPEFEELFKTVKKSKSAEAEERFA